MEEANKIYTYDELREKLTHEHCNGHYYRGQLVEYDACLFPSMYRPMEQLARRFIIPEKYSLRGRGRSFGLCANTISRREGETEQLYQERFNLRQRKKWVMGHTRNALGYPLAEAVFQQAGWDSEGLDVTSCSAIAFYFAMHAFHDGRYVEVHDCIRPHIIYRWNIKQDSWSQKQLNEFSYANCPQLIPTKEIFAKFERCCSTGDFFESIRAYRSAIGWNAECFDPSSVSGNRPYHLISLPAEWLHGSRIFRQEASLLIPDAISDEYFEPILDALGYKIEPGFSGIFLEDLASSCSCEKFYFVSNGDDCKRIGISPQDVYPDNDITHALLDGWVRTYFLNGFGSLPMDFGEFGAHNYDEIYANNEKLFNK